MNISTYYTNIINMNLEIFRPSVKVKKRNRSYKLEGNEVQIRLKRGKANKHNNPEVMDP